MRRVVFTVHALAEMELRKLTKELAFETLRAPDWREPDPVHPGRTRLFRRLEEMGGRVLRVVVEEDEAGVTVVTLFLDRNARRRS